MITMCVYLFHWLTLVSHHNLVLSNLSVLHASLPYHETPSSPVVEMYTPWNLLFNYSVSQLHTCFPKGNAGKAEQGDRRGACPPTFTTAPKDYNFSIQIISSLQILIAPSAPDSSSSS